MNSIEHHFKKLWELFFHLKQLSSPLNKLFSKFSKKIIGLQ